ncbi:MAG: peptidylprolyl isomerase, partial [Pseudomonadota bacterium]|nr:peptidylprolyl isomerase [Pseudomonadota bacterium]
MRRSLLATAAGAFALALGSSAIAQTPPPTPAPAATPAPDPAATPAPDPVVARVGDHEIHASDVAMAATGLPPQLRGMPPQMLFPMLLDQMIDREALTIAARKQGLENTPEVVTQMRLAQDRILQNALLQKEVGPKVTDEALHAVYDRDYANKPGEQEVHARQILVPTEEQAKKIIGELQHGGDFAEIAKTE